MKKAVSKEMKLGGGSIDSPSLKGDRGTLSPPSGGVGDGKVSSPSKAGDKGIPSGIKGDGYGMGKGVQNVSKDGNRGIPPMNANPTAPAPKD